MTTCWILTEGMIGTQNQCVALAEAAGLDAEIKVVKPRQPWKFLCPWLPIFGRMGFGYGSSTFQAPWPNILIASGRKAIAPALWIKKQSRGQTKLVIVQSPVITSRQFDLVIVPQHDDYKGRNILQTMGALSVITPETLQDAHTEWQATLGQLPAPRLAVLIGGNSRTHKLTDHVVNRLVMQLRELRDQGFGLMITASRRTATHHVHQLREALTPHPRVLFFDGKGENPYRGFLAWADYLLVTEDSVSMACEAVSTGKPVYILKMAGGSKRFARFHNYLLQSGFARWFDGTLEDFTYEPPHDLERAAQAVRALY